jgi:hypothetical protein
MNLTEMLITSFISELIDEMDFEDALTFLTLKWAEYIGEVINAEDIPREITEETMKDILGVLREVGITDLSYD